MNFEYKFLKYIQEYTVPIFVDKLMRLSSMLTDNGYILIFMSILFALSHKYKKMGYLCLASLMINAIVCNVILKPIIARARPFEKFADLPAMVSNLPTDYSFPSGHTSASFAFATAVFIMDKKLGIIAYAFATCVAMSRMYLMVHYPTDVIGGIILGVSVAIFCNKMF